MLLMLGAKQKMGLYQSFSLEQMSLLTDRNIVVFMNSACHLELAPW